MKIRITAIVLAALAALALAGCSPSGAKTPSTPAATPTATPTPTPTPAPSASDEPSPPAPDDPVPPDPDSPSPEAPPQGAAAPALLEMVSQVNADLKSVAEEMKGICQILCEARGTGTLAVVFKAEDPIMEDLDMVESMAGEMAPIYTNLPALMATVDISDPKVLIEFLGMGGEVIYSREFSLDTVPDAMPSADVTDEDSEQALKAFVETQQSVALDMEEEMNGLAAVTIEGRGTGTLAYVFHVRKFDPFAGLTEESIKDEAMPEFETIFSTFLPAMASIGIKDPSIVIEFYRPDGTLIVSTELK